jgi:hypothetical protein
MSAEGGHLGWRSGSLDTILKIDHLRTIHAMFALNWLTGFREEDYMSSMVLRWSTSKIVFSDPNLGSKWPPSADIVLT